MAKEREWTKKDIDYIKETLEVIKKKVEIEGTNGDSFWKRTQVHFENKLKELGKR